VNSIILNPGSPMNERLRRAAREWIDSGRSAANLPTGTAFFLAQCWLYGSDARERRSPAFRAEIQEYVDAAKTSLGGEAGWNALLNEKAFCSHCHMSFHLENIGICADCLEYVCPSCKSAHAGRCGGEVVG
jgi:hypothetical protein